MSQWRGGAGDILQSPRFANILTTTAVGTAVFSSAIERTIGSPGLVGMVATLLVLAIASLNSRRAEIQWHALLPVSLLVYLVWAALSIVWSQYQWVTLWALCSLFAFSVLGLYIALFRDTIQIVRAFGDVLRFTLVVSLALELLSGLLIDMPIRFLGIEGKLGELGPIQGVMGTRNQLALIALLAIVTFGAELRTKSVNRGLGITSLVFAVACLGLSRSPVMGGIVVLAALAAVALFGIRRVPAARRTFWQLVLLGLLVIGGVIAWAFRARIMSLFNASGDLNYRLTLWGRVWELVQLHPLEGWGWMGEWKTEIQPYTAFVIPGIRIPGSALNAFVDVLLQLGLIGLVIFVGLVGLTFVRSWLLAGQRKSFVFAWPALTLVVLIAASFAESSILVEWGWLTFVVCSAKAASELSWKRAFARPLPDDEELA